MRTLEEVLILVMVAGFVYLMINLWIATIESLKHKMLDVFDYLIAIFAVAASIIAPLVLLVLIAKFLSM